jgi:predicted RNase H-like nuclease
MRYIGVDGFRRGWIAILIDSAGMRSFHILNEIAELEELAENGPYIAMIDMPIGLPDSGYRDCDLSARRTLGKARNRVFLGARRFLLQQNLICDYAAANASAKVKDDKGIAIQLFCILPKIKQLDDFMNPSRAKAVREMHPELVFFRLNGNRYLESKNSEKGQNQRRRLLANEGFSEIDRWHTQLRGTGVKVDDLLDACAGAIAAQKPLRLKCKPEIDSKGLRMEMWY